MIHMRRILDVCTVHWQAALSDLAGTSLFFKAIPGGTVKCSQSSSGRANLSSCFTDTFRCLEATVVAHTRNFYITHLRCVIRV